MLRMKNKFFIILVIFFCSCVSVVLHGYLSMRGGNLIKGGVAGSSLCQINSTFNCDNTLATRYSQFLGLPLSDWGLALNALLAVITFIVLSGMIEGPATVLAVIGFLTALSAGASLLLLSVSYFVLNMFCPVCIVLYILSFISAWVFYTGHFVKSLRNFFAGSLKEVFKKLDKNFLIGCVSALAGAALLSNRIFLHLTGANTAQKRVPALVLDWKASPLKPQNINLSYKKGAKPFSPPLPL